MGAQRVGAHGGRRQPGADAVEEEEGSADLDLVLAVTALGLVPVIGGHRDEPVLAELLVALAHGLDQVARGLIDPADLPVVLGRIGAVGVADGVGPLQVDDGAIGALVQELPRGPGPDGVVGGEQ